MITICRVNGTPGQIGYGLKHVAKAMKKHNLIQTIWDTNNSVSDGIDAAAEALKAYDNYSDADKHVYFRNVIDYNYVDCKVMQEIVNMLRSIP